MATTQSSQTETKRKAFFHVTRAQDEKSNASNITVPNDPIRKRSISTPHDLTQLQVLQTPTTPDSGRGSRKLKKKHFSLRKIFKRDRTPSTDEVNGLRKEELEALEQKQRQTELEFAHTLMTKPEDMISDLCRVDSEPNLVQTICAPNIFSKDVIKLDKKLYQVDVANARIATLSRLSGTAILVKDYQALEFLRSTTLRIRKQNVTLFKEVDKYLKRFKQDPSSILCERKDVFHLDSPKSPSDKVQFIITDEDDQDSENLRWEMNSLCFSTENSSNESDDEGPSPEQVSHLAHEIRKAEGTRFKRRKSKHTNDEHKTTHLPPPPNPLAHPKRALLRSHATVPNGLCQQGSKHISSSMLHALDAEDMDSVHSRRRFNKSSHNTILPFNLLSLTGQLSWLVSEYVPRDTSTYKWATDLIHKISTMSVTRATWLNVHQQLRETTELLYAHRDRHNASIRSKTAKGEIAWNHLQVNFEMIQSGEGDNATVTAETVRKVFGDDNQGENGSKRHLMHLSGLLEQKFHLAYVCDLILWRAHKLLFATRSAASADMAEYQLMDFRIRHMQLRLDQANIQNWSSELTDWMTCWIADAIDSDSNVKNEIEDNYCLDELKLMQLSVKRFQTLVKHIEDSEFLSEKFLAASSPVSESSEIQQHHHHHYHPHMHHHGEGGHQQDLRPLEANRCSQTYSALVRQIHEHAMSSRPLSYFAERALYDMAVELECPVDWKERLDTLSEELKNVYNDWELLLQAKLNPDYQKQLFPPNHTGNEPTTER